MTSKDPRCPAALHEPDCDCRICTGLEPCPCMSGDAIGRMDKLDARGVPV